MRLSLSSTHKSVCVEQPSSGCETQGQAKYRSQQSKAQYHHCNDRPYVAYICARA